MNECKSCNFQLNESTSYCSECGAKVVTERLTIGGLLKTFVKLVTNLEAPFFKTTISLITDTKAITLAYINGKRKVITSPIRYALIALTVYGVFQFVFQDFINQLAQGRFLGGVVEGFSDASHERTGGELNQLNHLQEIIQKHSQFTNFFAVPILAFFCFIFISKNKLNYAEHFSISLYAISFSLLLGATLGIFIGSFTSDLLEYIYSFLTMVVNVLLVNWILWKSYEVRLIKIVNIFIASYLILLLLFAAIILIYSSLS